MKSKSSISFDDEGNSFFCYDCQKNMMQISRANSTVLDRSHANVNNITDALGNVSFVDNSFVSPIHGNSLLNNN